MMPSIIIENLSRVYASNPEPVHALSDISFSIDSGECFGVLGPNGAGKTTLLKILSTQLLASSGRVNILGFDIESERAKIRPLINIINGGEQGHYPWLSARETLEYFMYLYQINCKTPRTFIEHLLTLVGLDRTAWERPVTGYSKGMKQRLHIARGLINSPRVLFLDEPTIGLDIDAVAETRELLNRLKNEGTTIIMTSHNMQDIDATCERMAIIDHGKCKALRTLVEMRANYRSIVALELRGNTEELISHLSKFSKILKIEAGEYNKLNISLLPIDVVRMHRVLIDLNIELINLHITQQSLEHVYTEMMGA